VSRGSQEIIKLLPHKIINQSQLEHLVNHPEEASSRLVYLVITTVADWSEHNEGKSFNKEDYYAHPENYRNTFYEKFAPYVTCILNCMYWDSKYPRLINNDQMCELFEQGKNRLIAVGDITCDPMGSIEALIKTTSIDNPCFIYDPLTGDLHDAHTETGWIYKPGVLFCAVDNFPTEFPKEATEYFGDHLMPFLEAVVKSDSTLDYNEQNDIPEEIRRGMITCHGKLTPSYQYISDLRKVHDLSQKSFLVLGAGFVSIAAISYLSRNSSYTITVADITVEQVNKAVGNRKNVKGAILDVKDDDKLDKLIRGHSIVISLIPADLHIYVAKSCIRTKRHMVTSSYINPEIKSLSQEAIDNGLTILCETGLDPGLDHMEALRVISEVKSKGGKIRSFVSWCGGLPMPEASMNPFGYKFSWSPRGVLLASTQSSKYIQESQERFVHGNDLFSRRQEVSIFPGFSLEGIPNRDSTVYIDQYGLGNDTKTFFRGTLRYTGWGAIMQGIVQLGLLSTNHVSYLDKDAPDMTWNDALRKHLGAKERFSTSKTIKHILRPENGFPNKGFDDDQSRKITNAMKWLGMMSDNIIAKKGNWLDCMSDIMSNKMVYDKLEYDMIILHHIFGVEFPDGKLQTITSTLVVHGTEKMSAMAKTVAIPASIAAELIIEGKIDNRGVIGPLSDNIYIPILKSLKPEGIQFIERVQKSQKL